MIYTTLSIVQAWAIIQTIRNEMPVSVCLFIFLACSFVAGVCRYVSDKLESSQSDRARLQNMYREVKAELDARKQ